MHNCDVGKPHAHTPYLYYTIFYNETNFEFSDGNNTSACGQNSTLTTTTIGENDETLSSSISSVISQFEFDDKQQQNSPAAAGECGVTPPKEDVFWRHSNSSSSVTSSSTEYNLTVKSRGVMNHFFRFFLPSWDEHKYMEWKTKNGISGVTTSILFSIGEWNVPLPSSSSCISCLRSGAF